MENCNLHLKSKVALGLALASIAGACATRKFGENAGVKHAESTFLARQSLTQGWADVTPENHSKLLKIFKSHDNDTIILNSNHIVSQRIQYWIDKIDMIYRKNAGEKAVSIPKPKAYVIDSRQDNAFVSPVVICLEKPVVAKSFAIKSTNIVPTEPGVITNGTRFFSGTEYSKEPSKYCTPASEKFTPDKVVEYLNLLDPQCNVTFTGTKFIIEDACIPELSDGRVASHLGILTTSNQIAFHTKLMKSLTAEAEFVNVIAHELGHYYGAHASYKLNEFVYQQKGKKNEAKLPTELRIHGHLIRDGRASEVLLILNSLVDETFTTVIPKTVAKAIFTDPRLLPSAATKIESCRLAEAELTNLKSANFNWTFSKDTPLVSRNVTYPLFEKYFIECAKAIKIVDNFADTLIAKSPSGTLQGAVTYLGLIYRDMIKHPKSSQIKTLWDGIVDLKMQLDSISGRLEPAKRELHAKNLGIYTAEQEADEFAIGMMSKLNLDPNASVNALMDHVEMGAKTPMPPGYEKIFPKEDPTECAKKLKNGWLKDGVYQFENIGAFTDSHHSSCYRVFNASREILAHNYPSGESIDETKTPGGTWANILKLPLEGFKEAAELKPEENKAALQKFANCASKAASLNISLSMCSL